MANKEQNSEFAKYMRKHPGRYPDSISKGGHRGNGADMRDRFKGSTRGTCNNSGWQAGIMGGILAQRLGYDMPFEYQGFV